MADGAAGRAVWSERHRERVANVDELRSRLRARRAPASRKRSDGRGRGKSGPRGMRDVDVAAGP